jgi:hypothetical protein
MARVRTWNIADRPSRSSSASTELPTHSQAPGSPLVESHFPQPATVTPKSGSRLTLTAILGASTEVEFGCKLDAFAYAVGAMVPVVPRPQAEKGRALRSEHDLGTAAALDAPLAADWRPVLFEAEVRGRGSSTYAATSRLHPRLRGFEAHP